MANTTQTEMTNDVLAADEDFMAELEAELNGEGAVEIEEPVENVDEITAADFDAELEAALEAVETESEPEPEQQAEASKPEKKKAKGKKKVEASETDADEKPEPKKRMSLSGMMPSEAIPKALGSKLYEYCVTTQEQVTMDDKGRADSITSFLTNDVDKLAKKVREKAINMFQAVAGQSKLSVFTEMALALLTEKGEFAIGDLKAAYLDRPYSPGTASAQSSQMMMLLPALNIAKREGNKLVLVEDSPLFKTLTE